MPYKLDSLLPVAGRNDMILGLDLKPDYYHPAVRQLLVDIQSQIRNRGVDEKDVEVVTWIGSRGNEFPVVSICFQSSVEKLLNFKIIILTCGTVNVSMPDLIVDDLDSSRLTSRGAAIVGWGSSSWHWEIEGSDISIPPDDDVTLEAGRALLVYHNYITGSPYFKYQLLQRIECPETMAEC